MPKARDTGRIERQGIGVAISAFETLGFAFREQHESDFGVDAHVERIECEQPTGQLLGIQLKTGQSYFSERSPEGFIFRFDRQHFEYWTNHSLPIIVVLCDLDERRMIWEQISAGTTIPTGDGFKVVVPYDQIVDSASAPLLKGLLTPVLPPDAYTVFRLDDVSHGTAKRYSLDVVFSQARTRAEMAAVIRQATAESVKRRYYRNHMTQGRWGDSDADVVWIFGYLSPNDRVTRNWACRSVWIRENLPSEARPSAIEGENIGGLITVEWKKDYLASAERAAQHSLNKEQYLGIVIPMVDELHELNRNFQRQLAELRQGQQSEAEFLLATSSTRKRIHEVYTRSGDVGLPPFECSDIDDKLQEVLALMDNLRLFYSQRGRDTWTESERLHQACRQVSDSSNALQQLNYELSKAR